METQNNIDAELRQLSLSDDEKRELCQAFLRINNPLPDVDGEWEKVSQSIRKPRRTTIYILSGVAAAACIVLAFLLIPRLMAPAAQYAESGRQQSKDAATTAIPRYGNTATTKNNQATAVAPPKENIKMLAVETTHGQDKNITLPDGSHVWLNADSQLTYPSQFADGKREVRIHGEGYFEVRHDPRRPFVVTTDYFTTTVLGTVFNINAYNRKDACVVLISGRVSVSSGDPTIQYVIKPGQKAVCGNDGAWSVTRINTYPYTQRKAGFFYFDQQPLHDIMAEIGRWYRRTVVFENTDAANMRLHFVAERNDKLENVIESLNRMDGISVSLEKGGIIIR